MADKTQLGPAALDMVPGPEKVYLELVRTLMSGQPQPGQKMTSRKLAKELGTSDMPVRSAFMRLQALRALSPMPNGSVEVPLISADRFQQLTDVRMILEGTATELATKLINGNNLRAIRRHCTELARASRSGDIDDYLRKNHDFKFSIYRHCGNEQMIFLIETVWMPVGPFNLRIGFEDDPAGILETSRRSSRRPRRRRQAGARSHRARHRPSRHANPA